MWPPSHLQAGLQHLKGSDLLFLGICTQRATSQDSLIAPIGLEQNAPSHPEDHDFTLGFWSLGSEASSQQNGCYLASSRWIRVTRGDAKKTHPFIHPERWELPVRSHTNQFCSASNQPQQPVAPAQLSRGRLGFGGTLGSVISEDTGEIWAVCCTFSSGRRLTRA